jgi:hypothetical protein
LKNEPEKLLKTQDHYQKTNRKTKRAMLLKKLEGKIRAPAFQAASVQLRRNVPVASVARES